jgi:hypothetical protein
LTQLTSRREAAGKSKTIYSFKRRNTMLEKTRLNFYRLLSAILLVAVLLLSGVTYVSAHGGDVTLIHACVTSRSGAVRIVSPTTTCDASKETALDWGIQGPKGDKGDTGPKGPAGVLGIYYVTQSSDPNVVSEFTVVQASCTPGDKVTGGGFTNSSFTVLSSGPDTERDDTWKVVGYAYSAGGYATAIAVCADMTP